MKGLSGSGGCRIDTVRITAGVPALALALLVGGLPTPASAQDYYTDIRPVLVDACMGCHIDEGVGWSMEDPEEAYERRHSIALAVTSGSMPPWLADSHVQEYVDDLSLEEEVIAVFAAWQEADFPRGEPRADPDVLPEPVGAFAADLSLAPLPGDAHTPDPTMDNDYRCFIVDWPREEPGYVTGFRMEPGNPGIAHHAVLDVVEPGMVDRFRELEEEEEGPGYQCFSGPAVPDRLMDYGDEQARAAYEARHPGGIQDLLDGIWRLEVWAPGTWGGAFPEGTGVRIEPGSAIAVQMHYFTGNAPPGEVDTGTRIHLRIADHTERRAFVFPQTRMPWLYGEANRSMVIPPGESATYEVTHDFEALRSYAAWVTGVEEERIAALEVHSANLHMHAFGRSGEITLVDSHGRSETLLSVPRWDFDWQRDFTFTEPRVVPRDEMAQTRLRLRCTFHNSTEEPVYGGFGSLDEMCVNFAFIAVQEHTPDPESTDSSTATPREH